MPISKSRPQTVIFRQGTSQEWAQENVAPLPGELIIETDTGRTKIGSETTDTYDSTPYFGTGTYVDDSLRFVAGKDVTGPIHWRATLGGTVPWRDTVVSFVGGQAPDVSTITLSGAIQLQDGEEITISTDLGGSHSLGITGLEDSWYVKNTSTENEYEIYYDKELTSLPTFNLEETYNQNSGQVLVDDYVAWAVAVDYDANGNLFTAGTTGIGFVGSVAAPYIAKYSPTGSLLWQKTFESNIITIFGYGMAADPSGDVFLAGQTADGVDMLVLKVSGSDGSILWQKYLVGGPTDNVGNDDLEPFTLDVGSDGNPVVVGYYDQDSGNSNSNEYMVIKLSGTDGSVLWQKYLGDNSGPDDTQRAFGMGVGPDDSIVFTGRTYDLDTDTDAMTVAKLSSSGTLVWQKKISNPNPLDQMVGADIAVGPNGEVYAVGHYFDVYDGSTRPFITVFKMNSNGSMQWSRRVGPNTVGPACDDVEAGLAVDSEGKLYLTVATYVKQGGGQQRDLLVASYDSDGNVLWQNYLGKPLRYEIQPEWSDGRFGGQFIATFGNFLAVCGAQEESDINGGTGNLPGNDYPGAFVIQFPKDGTAKNIGGTLFRPSTFQGVPNIGLTATNTNFTLYDGNAIILDEQYVLTSVSGNMFSVLETAPPKVEHTFEMTDEGVFATPAIELTGNPFVEDLFVGEPVKFVRTNYGEEVDVISDNLVIGRNSYNGGILNVLEDDYENGYNGGSYDGEPTGTEWNAEGWDYLYTTSFRTYLDWNQAISGGGNAGKITGMELIMHDTYDNKYYAIKFHTWQNGGNGGGFSYTRREINTSIIFFRPDGEDDSVESIVDEVGPGLSLARGNGGALFNYALEQESYGDYSPLNTLWNAEGWSDLSNLTERSFLNFESIFEGAVGKQIEGSELVMWDTNNNKYYAIKFAFWQKGGGIQYPGYAYQRREIDVSRIKAGIKFPDGTVQTTAYNQKSAGILPQITHSLETDRWFTLDDMGKHILVGLSATNLVIPDYLDVPFPIGATITIINISGGNFSISCDNDDENNVILGAGTADTGTIWVVPDNGGGNVVTLIKIRQYEDEGALRSEWILSGSGIYLAP